MIVHNDNQILISHRGNLAGPEPVLENTSEYIDQAILAGYQVEIDIWSQAQNLFLGHDHADHAIDLSFLQDRREHLWCHAKNIEAFVELRQAGLHAFYHQTDDFALTTQNYLWVYPGKSIVTTALCVAVMPELVPGWEIDMAWGVCSDYIIKFKKETK